MCTVVVECKQKEEKISGISIPLQSVDICVWSLGMTQGGCSLPKDKDRKVWKSSSRDGQ